ncbi:MAG: hypothetical protein HF314_12135 [Ignavibacteria bacterium]|jgi:phage host-nuclease inhibitor protein Gam|nr:hypothetical protein [Ignavibacteria bacterium]MCU7503820.1 hypothetical protein [Ignavibacteria bacterium]MCU7517166.1 hypothetical protein [Ignavibacteria bacterium]
MSDDKMTVGLDLKNSTAADTMIPSSHLSEPKEKIRVLCWSDVDRSLLQIGREEAFIAKKEAELNKRIQLLTENMQTVTEKSRNNIQLHTDAIKVFCMKNKDDFKTVKSKSFSYGEVGFRSLPGKVMLLSKKFNWDITVKLMREAFGKKYIRVILELNKEKILEAVQRKRRPLDPEKLIQCGIKIQKGERFFLQAKWEEIQKEEA